MMNTIVLKNGKTVVVRLPHIEDAVQIVNFYNKIGGETDFLSFGKNQYPQNFLQQQTAIEQLLKSTHQLMLLALDEDEIIGIITLTASPKERFVHVGQLGIGICKEYWHCGLGSFLIKQTIDFARNNGVTKKIALITREDNTAAIQAYKRFDFEVEGVLKNENFCNGAYFNSLQMGLWL